MLDTALIENEDGRFLVLKNDTLGQHLMRGERWEQHFARLAKEVVREGSYVADVGANIGYNAVILGKLVGEQGKVFAFEPLRITYQQLCANALLNNLENIHPYNVVLGSADNVVVSMIPIDYREKDINIMNTCVGLGGEVVMMRTLDSYELPSLSFLKIDVQGCELIVLKGAEQTITKHRPTIFIEIEEPQLRHHNTSSEEVMTKLLSFGYSMLWNESVSIHDWIAVPAENGDLQQQVVAALGPGTQVFQAP